MTERFAPSRPEDLAEILGWAVANRAPLAVTGSGSKAGIGRPVAAAHELCLAGLSGIRDYEPGELVLTAGAGTPLAEVEALLAAHRQQLAFEPPDHARIGRAPAAPDAPRAGTLGGVVAANLSGPRRLAAGAARDHCIGLRAYSGRGEPFKSGGRVVKNVTGFDLPKLLSGSWGTLAVLWEVTLKVVPAPELARSLLLFGLDPAAAARAMNAALCSVHVVTGAAHLPVPVAARCPGLGGAGRSVTALRMEGPEPSVRHRLAGLQALLGGDSALLGEGDSGPLWRAVGDLAPLAVDATRELWRLVLPPASAPAVLAALTAEAESDWLLDQGGGTLWLACPAGTAAEAIRAALRPAGGHATLWHASPQRRAVVPVFQPQPPALAALTRRVKASFDPRAVLNPGRMYSDL
ncbi:MAG: FAD-binding protein [Porticoccaceae bacterium]